ncbi:MAG TPA: pentapeptide repeat-containing protein [Solirubrobacter sp.]
MFREATWLAVLVLLLGAAAAFAFFELPNLVITANDLAADVPAPANAKPPTAPTGYDLVQARNGARVAGVALIAGIGAALATGFAGRTFYLARRGQIADRFAKASEKLDAAAKVSAIGELEALAAASPELKSEAARVLAAFIRDYDRSGDGDDAKPPQALQDACTALGENLARSHVGSINLAEADLRNVNLARAYLPYADLRDANLRGAIMAKANLRGALLSNARAQSGRFEDAKLVQAHLDGAQLQGATFDRANAFRADFTDAGFAKTPKTYMRGTRLQGAYGFAGDTLPESIETDSRTKRPNSHIGLWLRLVSRCL